MNSVLTSLRKKGYIGSRYSIRGSIQGVREFSVFAHGSSIPTPLGYCKVMNQSLGSFELSQEMLVVVSVKQISRLAPSSSLRRSGNGLVMYPDALAEMLQLEVIVHPTSRFQDSMTVPDPISKISSRETFC